VVKTKEKQKTCKAVKQLTLDTLTNNAESKKSDTPTVPGQEKQIIITEIGSVTKEDELVLKVVFKLLPSKSSFSKVRSDLWFNDQRISSRSISIPQSPLAVDQFELTPVLDMKGIPTGPHLIRVELYELWSTGERLCQANKEVTVDYVPMTRAERLVKVPIVKSVAGQDLEVVSRIRKRNLQGNWRSREERDLQQKRRIVA
jgi:hypothetical protein